ncbi:MAG: alpha/beta hydrolase [Planctomycetes bacterium]|nr:alpha/beta hydrolase [Planctomycetota bacterium]
MSTPSLMPTPNLCICAPDNPFADVPLPLRTSTVDVVYATDRVPEGESAQDPRYGFRRSKSLAFGTTRVSIGEDLSWDELVAANRSAEQRTRLPMGTIETHELGRFPMTPTPQVERDGQMVESPGSAATRLAAEAGFKALLAERLALTPKKEAYVFIHGSGSHFEDPMYVVAGLWHFMGRQGVPVAYTWPAGGGTDILRNYTYDRESSEFTVHHLKQFLRLLASCPGVEKVHVIAHSRGTGTALAALRELNIEIRASGGDTRRVLKIGCFVLAAADMDLEVSTQRVSAEHLMRVPEQMVLYVSPSDSQLGMAEWLFEAQGRLGQVEAEDLPRRQTELLQHLTGIQFIDCSVAGSGSDTHEYFYGHPAVSSDLILLLRDGRRPGAENGRPLSPRTGGIWRIHEEYPSPAKTGAGR